jgi:ABC-type spermidine/putrescine transport system permease subunit II
MGLADFIRENVYLPYFRRHSARARSQQILLGVAIGALVIAAVVGWWLWRRRSRTVAVVEEVSPSDD